MNFNCAANFQDDNSNDTADLHMAERVLIPEEQVNTLNEETRALVEGAAPISFPEVRSFWSAPRIRTSGRI